MHTNILFVLEKSGSKIKKPVLRGSYVPRTKLPTSCLVVDWLLGAQAVMTSQYSFLCTSFFITSGLISNCQ